MTKDSEPSANSTSFNYTDFQNYPSKLYDGMNRHDRLRSKEENYSSDISTPYPEELMVALNNLSKETLRNFERSHMMVPETERKFLYHLIKLLRPINILEIGTFTGASAITMAFAQGNKSNGRLVSLDINPKCMDVAHKYVKQLQLENQVDLRLGSALDSLKELVKDEPSVQFDFIFIDAYKDQNTDYFNFIMDNNLLSDRGVIVVDDVLFHGLVHRLAGYEEMCPIESEHWELQAKSTFEFNRHVKQDPRVQVTVLPIFNGLSLISKKID